MKSTFRAVLIPLLVSLTMPALVASLSPISAVAAANEPTRQQVVNEGLKFLGYPYAYDGTSPDTGFSCIGFVSYVFRSFGIDMPPDLAGAMAAYPRIKERDLLPGDIVFFHDTWTKGLSHVALYIGDGKVIHAENPSTGVVITYLRNDPTIGNYMQQHYLTSERPLVGTSTIPAPSKTTGQGTVVATSLNLRRHHYLRSVVETVLPKGSMVFVLAQWKSWFKVQTSNGVTGWVVKAGVQVGGKPSGAGAHHGGSGRANHVYPVVAGVNIHTGPSIADSVIAVTTPGMTVKVLRHRQGLTQIRTPASVAGWVLSKFVQVSRAGSAGSGKSSGTHQHHRASPGRLIITAHLRTGPSLSDRIIRWVKAGTNVKVLDRVPQWDHVRVGGRLSGYIYSEYVKG